jgi:DNA polymerase III alpha subunit
MKQLQSTLSNRILRFDGVSIVDPDAVSTLILSGLSPSKIRVTGVTDDIIQHNSRVSASDKISLSTNEPLEMDMSWSLPNAYLQIDLIDYFGNLLALKFQVLGYTHELQDAALLRVAQELEEVHNRGMTRFMQTMIYVIDVFKQNSVVWGVGRGSSCASYLLFLLGVHIVDCVKMDISLDEFFHD